jgi:hypothetical protein
MTYDKLEKQHDIASSIADEDYLAMARRAGKAHTERRD